MSIALPWRSLKVRVRDPRIEVPREYVRARNIMIVSIILPFLIGPLLIPMFIADDPLFSLFLVLGSLSVLFLFVDTLCTNSVPPRGLTNLSGSSPLMFAVIRVQALLGIAAAVSAFAGGVVGLISSSIPESFLADRTGRYTPALLVAASLYALFDYFKQRQKVPGITLSDEGIHWQDLKHSGTITWEDLERVELGAHKGKKRLYLHEYGYGGDLHIIEPSGLGSDPIVIAEVIDYFRRHPRDRQKLHDPQAALALVTEPIGEQP